MDLLATKPILNSNVLDFSFFPQSVQRLIVQESNFTQMNVETTDYGKHIYSVEHLYKQKLYFFSILHRVGHIN